MRLSLVPHPSTPSTAVQAIEVEVERPLSTRLSLLFRVTGDPTRLVIPPPAWSGILSLATPSSRADGLWRTTCFEAFVRPAPGEAYFEFNVAPSLQWAAYRFDAYRAGIAPLEVASPAIGFLSKSTGCELTAHLTMPPVAAGLFSLSAVIEERGGAKSYWALAHAAERPDFHDFVGVPLPPPEEQV
jgi:hypothetical protein